MLRNKCFLVLLGVLLIATITFNAAFFSRRTVKSTEKRKADAQSVPVAMSGLRMIISPDREQWRRDPFVYGRGNVHASGGALKDSVGKRKTGFNLEAVTVGKNACYAVVNGEIVKEGDTVNGLKIIEIKRHAVIVTDGRKKREISIF